MISRALFVVVAAACFIAACANVDSVPEKFEVTGIDNFSLVTGPASFAGSPVGVGGATDPSAMPALEDMGFTTVINLRLSSEEGASVDASRRAAEAAGMNYIHLPLDPRSSTVGETVSSFLAAAGDTADQPIYVHCHSGTRAAAVWMIGRVIKDGWTADAAAKEARAIAEKPDEAIEFANAYLSNVAH